MLYEKYLKNTPYQMFPATNLRDAGYLISSIQPKAIIVDILLEGEDSWGFVAEMKRGPHAATPTIIVSTVDDVRKGLSLGAEAYFVKPVDREALLRTLDELVCQGGKPSVLVIDDDDGFRYVLRRYLAGRTEPVFEAGNGLEGVQIARRERPELIFLDLVMPGASGVEVLCELKQDAATREIPVIIATSKSLDSRELEQLQLASCVVGKDGLDEHKVATLLSRFTGAQATAGHIR
jgi:CheY-like chemotaxis protein